MALRIIRTLGDPVLRKKSKEVKEITPRIKILIEDMLETMYDANGVGLAAPQVGVLKRIFVVDVSDSSENNGNKKNKKYSHSKDSIENNEHHVFINPEIIKTSGEQEDFEGCLSVPDKAGKVKRPDYVKIKAYDEDMNEFEIEVNGYTARAVLHEYDHLDGIVYVDRVDGRIYTTKELEEMSE